MKVVILVAEEEEYPGLIGPKCFTLTIGAVSLIEYLVRTLRLLAVAPDEITVVTGRSGGWEFTDCHDLLKQLGVREISVPTEGKRSFSSLANAALPANDGLLVLNGDRYFELSEIEYLLEDRATSAALVDRRNYVGMNQQVVEVKEGSISAIHVEEISSSVPWYSFNGAMFFSAEASAQLARLGSDPGCSYLSYLEVAVNIAGMRVAAIYPHKSLSAAHQTTKSSIDLSGGSFAGLTRSLVVRKFADHTGVQKLTNEIIWLQRQGENHDSKFPKVLDSNIREHEAWYTMPWYQYENLRKKIITGKISLDEFDLSLRLVLDYLWENLYSKPCGNPDSDWLFRKHFHRFYERLELISSMQPFSWLLKLDEFEIDGVKHESLFRLVEQVREYSDKYNCFTPRELVMIHGDLHFQNILMSDDYSDFIIADPRGELAGSDIFYDFGKLWHSFDGKYDLIHTDIARVRHNSMSNGDVEFRLDLGPRYLVDHYDRIGTRVAEIASAYPIATNSDWLLRIHFNQFMHFSSLMHFHLFYDGREKRSLILYLQAVKLGTRLLANLRRQYG